MKYFMNKILFALLFFVSLQHAFDEAMRLWQENKKMLKQPPTQTSEPSL